MTAIDPGQLLANILAAVNGAIGKDIQNLGGYAETKLQAIAKQGEMVASAYASGQIDQEVAQHFLDGIEDMATNFLRTLQGLARIEVEKAWNAMVGAIWDAISQATGGALSLVKPGL